MISLKSDLNVLFIIDDLFPVSSAGSVRVLSFARALESKCADIIILGGSADLKSDNIKCKYKIKTVSRPPERKTFSFAFFLAKLYVKSILIMQKSQTIVISVPKFELLWIVIFSKLFRKKIVVDFRDSPLFLDYYAYFKNKLPSIFADILGNLFQSVTNFVTKIAIKNADLVTCANVGIATDLKELTSGDSKEISIIPNGVSDVFLSHQTIKPSRLTNYYITYCGNYSEKDLFDPIISLLNKINKPYKLVLIGDGRNKSIILSKIKKLTTNVGIIDLGIQPHDKLPELLQKFSTIGVMFRNSDFTASIPVAIIEMMSLGIPVICNDVGLMSNFVKKYGGKVVSSETELLKIALWLDSLNKRPIIDNLLVNNLRNRLSRKEIANKFARLIYEL